MMRADRQDISKSVTENSDIMTEFKRYYIVLALALVIAVAGSASTPLGWDVRVGNISAGAAIGVMLALFVLRVAELRARDGARTAHLDFHSSSEIAEFTDSVVADASQAEVRAPDEPQVAAVSNILPFTVAGERVPVQIRGQEQVDARLCSCICGCNWKAKDKIAELCGNCRRWWQQQTLRCECNYIESDSCVCGAINHKPSHEIEFRSAA